MSEQKTHFLSFQRPDQIESVLKKISLWFDITLHLAPFKNFKVQSLQLHEKTFELTFTALSPIVGPCYIRFTIDEIIYQIDGELLLQNGGYVFTYKEFSRELKRRMLRVEVSEDYPAHFILEHVAGQKAQDETKVMDLHSDGFLFATWNALSIKAGDLVRGQMRVSKFNKVPIAGVVRHCIKKDGRIIAGVEIHHHEFGSEEKMIELMELYKRDVKNRGPS